MCPGGGGWAESGRSLEKWGAQSPLSLFRPSCHAGGLPSFRSSVFPSSQLKAVIIAPLACVKMHCRYTRSGLSCSRLKLRFFSNAGVTGGEKAYKPLSILAASEQGNVVDLKQALEKGVCIETRGRYGSTPLMFAAQFGHPSCVALLLNHGASMEAEFYGTTALSCAAVEGQMECMALLLNRGAQIDSVDEVE